MGRMGLKRLCRRICICFGLFPSTWAHSLFGAQEIWRSQIDNPQGQATQARRDLQSNVTECGQVIDAIGYLELRDLFRSLFVDGLNLASFELVVSSVDFGVQIRKICARCSDYPPGTTTCLLDDYGYHALHSGLLIVPLDENNQIKSGTSPVNILCHGTQGGNQDVPSNQWSRTAPDGQVLIAVLFTSISGAFGVVPDYTGYGESSDYFRAYIVKKGKIPSMLIS